MRRPKIDPKSKRTLSAKTINNVLTVLRPLVETSRDPLGRAIAFDVFQSFVVRVINDARARVPGSRSPLGGSGGSSSGPAELPVVEWGVTVPRGGRS